MKAKMKIDLENKEEKAEKTNTTVAKCDGILSILLEVFGSLVSGATEVAKAIDNKAAQVQFSWKN